MKTYAVTLIGLILALTIPTVTLASHHGGGHGYGCGKMNWDMSELDTDNDGVLTFEEYSSPNAKKWRSGFDMIDTNGDGEVDGDEWKTFLDMHNMNKG